MNHEYLFKKVSKETLKKKIELGLCIRHGCRNKSGKNRNDCETCKSRMFRIKNPKRYAYHTIKSSAAKRKIPFDLSFDEFLEFDKETGYTDKVGKNSDSLTIDRIDSSLPYRVGNIRALTWIDNCSKKLEGITETWEPVAKAIALVSGDDNWRKFRKISEEAVELQNLLEKSFNISEEEDENPF